MGGAARGQGHKNGTSRFGATAVEPGDDASCLFDDRDQRDDVIWMERRLQAEVDVPCGEHGGSITLTTEAGHQYR